MTSDEIFLAAASLGCEPTWYNGILGWRWHCNCESNDHGCDQQCSVITPVSLKSYIERNNDPRAEAVAG